VHARQARAARAPARLSLKCDLHLVAEQRSACLKHLIPGETEISTVELSAQIELYSLIVIRTVSRAVDLRAECDLTGDTAHRYVAHNTEPPAVEGGDLGRVEIDLWMVP